MSDQPKPCARCGREFGPDEPYIQTRTYAIHEGPLCPKVEPDEGNEE